MCGSENLIKASLRLNRNERKLLAIFREAFKGLPVPIGILNFDDRCFKYCRPYDKNRDDNSIHDWKVIAKESLTAEQFVESGQLGPIANQSQADTPLLEGFFCGESKLLTPENHQTVVSTDGEQPFGR